jgi:hypothetical protein
MVSSGEVFIEDESGAFVLFHTRRDAITIIYDICTPIEFRKRGIARQLIAVLPRPIELKCPIDNVSNGFYRHMGFKQTGILDRATVHSKRQLVLWRLD